jgi:hypothetical protein
MSPEGAGHAINTSWQKDLVTVLMASEGDGGFADSQKNDFEWLEASGHDFSRAENPRK